MNNSTEPGTYKGMEGGMFLPPPGLPKGARGRGCSVEMAF